MINIPFYFIFFLNKPLDLMILKMDKFRGNIVVSRKAISEVELKEQREELLSSIKEGSIIKGKVKNLTDYLICRTNLLYGYVSQTKLNKRSNYSKSTNFVLWVLSELNKILRLDITGQFILMHFYFQIYLNLVFQVEHNLVCIL